MGGLDAATAQERKRRLAIMQQNLIDQLEEAFERQDLRHRADTLRRVTDLFLSGSGKYSGEQIDLFGEVMNRLVEEIDVSARAAFGNRLASVADAPERVIRGLALDDAIEVAGPVLRHSERLDDQTLVESAKTKSQQHLLAISRRRVITEPITDVLVERGDHHVAVSTAGNVGAKFSEFGYSTLVQRAKGDDDLAVTVWVRQEIPRQHLLQLFAQASEVVRAKLEGADRGKANGLQDMIAQASNQIQTEIREMSNAYLNARGRITALHRAGKLDEALLARFAKAGQFDEATIALSVMADVPIGVVERAVASRRSEQILVLAKAIGVGWDTARAILLLQAGAQESPPEELDRCCITYARLQRETAKKAIQFYRLREQATAS
jgi:uncharacterized protein (DUF2336 family)